MAPSSHKDRLDKFLDAALDGNLDLLKQIGKLADNGEGLKETCERMKDSEGKSVLRFAAFGGRTRVCKYLIKKLKLDLNMKDKLGQTPLHKATIGNNLPTATYLLEHGANFTVADDRGSTALHYAAENGYKEFLRVLISRGAEVDAQAFNGTPLNCAAANGKKEAVKFLLDNNADPNSVSNPLFTPLMSSILEESFECMNLLLKAGADPNSKSFGATPLDMSISQGLNDFVKCLLKAGADANVPNSYGLTPLELTAIFGNHEGMMILFPVTTCIPGIPDWTPGGVVKHVHSTLAKQQRELKRQESFLKAKSNGRDAIKKDDYLDAVYWYTEAINIDSSDATVLSNRSLCWARLKEGRRALIDAEACISLEDKWPKAYYRAGAAYTLLKRYSEAARSFSIALGLDPENEDLQKAFREAAASG